MLGEHKNPVPVPGKKYKVIEVHPKDHYGLCGNFVVGMEVECIGAEIWDREYEGLMNPSMVGWVHGEFKRSDADSFFFLP